MNNKTDNSITISNGFNTVKLCSTGMVLSQEPQIYIENLFRYIFFVTSNKEQMFIEKLYEEKRKNKINFSLELYALDTTGKNIQVTFYFDKNIKLKDFFEEVSNLIFEWELLLI